MSSTKERQQSHRTTRREFVQKGGLAGAVLGIAAACPPLVRRAFVRKREYLLVGHPNPCTGPLAEFGKTSPWADQEAVVALGSQRGIDFVSGKRMPVRVKVVDTGSDPIRAEKVASELILKDNVDLIVVMDLPDTADPVRAACQTHSTPFASIDVPSHGDVG